MIFEKKELESYYMEVSGCFGHVKLGDFIAIMYLNEALRQDLEKPVKFVLSYNVLDSIKTMGHYFTERLIINEKTMRRYPNCPWSGNIWAMIDYIYKHTDIRLYMKNRFKKEFKEKRVVVNPLFNSPYHKDRNWTQYTFNNVLSYFDNEGYDIVVTGEGRIVEPMIDGNYKNLKKHYNNFELTIKDICTSGVYVGGDTGFTHVAAVTEYAPQKVIAIYGDDSEGRHNASYRDSIGMTMNQMNIGDVPLDDIKVDFTPKINNDKTLYYTIQKDFSIKDLNEFMGENNETKN